MVSYTIVRSSKTDRIYVYNRLSVKIAQCASMGDVFNFLMKCCRENVCKSVIFTPSIIEEVIFVTFN